jgi:hypothetical protein
MARKRANKTASKKSSASNSKKSVSKVDVTLMLLIVFTVIISIVIYGKGGDLHRILDPVISGIFGPIKYIIPVGSFLLCVSIFKEDKKKHFNSILKYSIIIILIASLFSMYHIGKGDIPIAGKFDNILDIGYRLRSK